MTPVTEFDVSVRAFNTGELLFAAIDGSLGDDFDTLRIKHGQTIVIEIAAGDIAQSRVLYLASAGGGIAGASPIVDKLARSLMIDVTSCVLVFSAAAGGSAFDLGLLKDQSRLNPPCAFSAQPVRMLAGAPVGNVISIFSASSDSATSPSPVVGGQALRQFSSQQDAGLACRDFRLPPEMFDGQSHDYRIDPPDDGVVQILTEWRCDESHELSGPDGLLHSRRWPSVFPDHEIARVATFMADSARHAADLDATMMAVWRSGQTAEASPPIRLVVFDLTLPAILNTPAAAQLRDLHRNRVEMIAVLPTGEAISFAEEMLRGHAPTQFIDAITAARLPDYIASQPDDAVFVFVPGGSTLRPEGIAEIYDVIAGKSIGAASGVVQRIAVGPVTIDMAPVGETSLDCSQAAAVFSKEGALKNLVTTPQAHEGAIIHTARFTNAGHKPLAAQDRRVEQILDAPVLHCIIDAQSETNVEKLTMILRTVQATPAALLLISPPRTTRDVSKQEGFADVRFLASPHGDVIPYLEDNLVGASNKPALHISAAALTGLSDHIAGLIPVLAGSGLRRARVIDFSVES